MQPHENADEHAGSPDSPAQANVQAHEYCRQKAGPPGSALYYALLQLRPSRRDAAYAVHAFCQEIADIHSAVHDPGVAHAKLDWWRQELARLFDGTPAHPVTRALAPVVKTFGLSRDAFEAVLHAAEMDLSQMRYLDFAGLDHYCDAAGGAPAELVSHVYGFDDARTPALARALGHAITLGRRVTDVGVDARAGYVYFPIDELQRFGVTAADLQNGKYSPAFVELMKFQHARARQSIVEAAAAMPGRDRRKQKPLLALAALQLALLDEVAVSDYQVLHQRIDLTPLRKFWRAWRAR
ncbi:presqualene diphosphate synthase HpnD [Pandoraea nosoerga]|uniref:Squalene synthase HpnD n=1 Tax=Pandoraea nosoerga TaxID=2508296 RepID=A0A5E4SBT9_9BURK|nr:MULTISPECIES: presqualene diphosphate synthase HpnD [Pandoraea]MBN4666958.1 presqualene diphosphate synthase HpnD [Pandoraea nosoerga]MBN4674827.1 presqualene diphosphate synthase HpnD [Pandoraea nosoerga]MBN4681806.1 presqualene diphosphate synthase HpnD [Pandoraea nosoerga]MBN4744122.1 presqualene diphosphate synthase HpnD [Pandoraea nosoerga]VVD72543.1 squalene synthase HpnD [Pandoraea nosoerga]